MHTYVQHFHDNHDFLLMLDHFFSLNFSGVIVVADSVCQSVLITDAGGSRTAFLIEFTSNELDNTHHAQVASIKSVSKDIGKALGNL